MMRYMSYQLGILFLSLFVLTACGSEGDARKKSAIKKDIKTYEKKVMEASTAGPMNDVYIDASDQLIGVLKEFYHAYPEDKMAPECVTKLHMLYAAKGDTDAAVAYGDTLLNQYPNYKNRSQVIESQIQTYEMLIKPRDVDKIRAYLKMWLKENPKASKEKIADMKYHLEYVDMSLEERMMMNMEALD
jgi:hypothetical protein